MTLFSTLLEFLNVHRDIRTIEPGKKDKDGFYSIHVDVSNYVLGYGNDEKIFKAIQKDSGVMWKFVDVRHDVLNMKTNHEFKKFNVDLGQIHLVRVK